MRSYSMNAVLIALSCVGVKIATAFEIEFPKKRMTLWSKLDSADKNVATKLGYTNHTWNRPGSMASEWATWYASIHYDYYDKNEDGYYNDTQPFQEYAEDLGFTEDIWDCWMTHWNYNWTEIVDWELEDAATALGWNETLWEDDDLKPDSDDKYWKELSNAEKTAAVAFCYLQPTWDEEKLENMCRDSPNTMRLSKNNLQTCDWVSQDLKRCENKQGGVSKHCPNTCGSCGADKCKNSKVKFLFKKVGDKSIWKKCSFTNKKRKKRCRNLKTTCRQTCNRSCRSTSEMSV